MNNKKRNIRIVVFLVPVLLLGFGLIFSMTAEDSFVNILNETNSMILSNFGWLYSFTTLVTLIAAVVAMLSPFGKIRIGGKDARSKLRNVDIFAIILCSIIGIGMVTWGTAEVMAHYSSPPATLGIEPYSTESANFAMRTIFLHWTFPAYSLYALPSLLFAFVYHNMHCPYSISSYFVPILGKKMNKQFRGTIDIVCIFSLICGMVGTVGTTVLSLLGGISYLSDNQIQKSSAAIAVILVLLVGIFVISSITGVMKGIRLLSNLNLFFFIGIAVFTFLCSSPAFILNYGIEGSGNFIQNFFSDILRTNAVSGDDWSYWWSIFYWAAYMAWAPVSSMFIGKICYGQTVRRIVMLTLVLPSVFTGIWMSVFSGTSMFYELSGYGISEAYKKGYEYTAYAVFEHLPLTLFVTILFLAIAALSVITASDSSTDVLAGLVVRDQNREEEVSDAEQITEKSSWLKAVIKILFGLIIGGSTFIVVAYSDISGIKMVSNIGAFPAMWIEIAIIAGLFRIIRNPDKYNDFSEKNQISEEDNGP